MKAVVIGVLIVIVAIPTWLVLRVFVPRALADRAVVPICEADGGIRVFEKIQLKKREFAIPENSIVEMFGEGRKILDDFRIMKRASAMRLYGAPVVKYTTWIERTVDNKRISEMTQYLREGDEMHHGKFCPDNVSEKSLIDQTFIPQGKFDPQNPPLCPNDTPTYAANVESVRSVPKKLAGVLIDGHLPTWARQYNCDGRMEIGSNYSQVAPGETRLTETSILFDPESGDRCRVAAMASPDRMLCTDDSVWLIGKKSISFKDDLTIQRYSWNGSLISEVTLKHSSIREPGRIVGFYATPDELGIEYVAYVGETNEGKMLCHRVTSRPLPLTEFEGKKLSEAFASWLPGCAGLH